MILRTQRVWAMLLLGLSVLSIAGCASLVRPNYTQTLTELRGGAYALDKEHAYVHFRIGHLGLSTVVGRFNTVDASLDFDPAELESLRLDGVIDMASVDVNNDGLENQLRGGSWFDVAQFPEARFESRAVVPGNDNNFLLEGDVTLRGVTQPIVLEARFNGGADNILTGKYTVGFTATGKLSRKAFGMSQFGALIADDVAIEIHAEFQKND